MTLEKSLAKLEAVGRLINKNPNDAEQRINQAVLLLQLNELTGDNHYLEKAKKVARYIFDEIRCCEKNNKHLLYQFSATGYIACHNIDKDYGSETIWGIKEIKKDDEIKKIVAMTDFLKDDPILNIPVIQKPLIYDDGLKLVITQTIPGLDGNDAMEIFYKELKKGNKKTEELAQKFQKSLLLQTAYWHSLFSLPESIENQEKYVEEGLEKILESIEKSKEELRIATWRHGALNQEDIETDYFMAEQEFLRTFMNGIPERFVNNQKWVFKRDSYSTNFVFYTGKSRSSYEDLSNAWKKNGLANILFNIDISGGCLSHMFEDTASIDTDYSFRDIKRDEDSCPRIYLAFREDSCKFIILRMCSEIFIGIAEKYQSQGKPHLAELRLKKASEIYRTTNPEVDLFLADIYRKLSSINSSLYEQTKHKAYNKKSSGYLDKSSAICKNVLNKSLNLFKREKATLLINKIKDDKDQNMDGF